jgi:hypothetical protein
MYIHGDLHENPRKGETSKKVINKGFLRDLEGYEQSDKNLFHLPRQEIERTFLLRLVGQIAAIGKNPTTVLLRLIRATTTCCIRGNIAIQDVVIRKAMIYVHYI